MPKIQTQRKNARWEAYKQVSKDSRHTAYKEFSAIKIVPLLALKEVTQSERPIKKQTTTEVQVQVLKEMEHLCHDGRHKTFAVGNRPHKSKELTWWRNFHSCNL